MHTSPRTWLALLRLLLLYALICCAALAAGLTLRDRRDLGRDLTMPATPLAALPFLGVTVELDPASPQDRQAALARLAHDGFGWVRVFLDWDAIEPTPDDYRWDAADRLIAAIVAAGPVPVLVLDNSPAWARDPRDRATPDGRHAPPADVTDFARFAAAVAARYGPSVRYYQLWDEPNIAPNWGARHIEAAGYAQLLKTGAAAIRGADADAVILLAALAPTADRGHTAQDEVYFLQRLYAAGAAPFFDAAAVQPFGFGATPRDPRADQTILNFRRVLLVRRAMVVAGDGTTPIWIVRYGWNRSPASPWGAVSPARQVVFAVDALDLAFTQWPWVAAQGWAIDQPAAPATDPRWGFALTHMLSGVLREWSHAAARTPRPAPPRPPWDAVGAGIAVLTGLLLLWRTWAAWRCLPRQRWRAWLRRRPACQHAALWTALIVVYYLATWPPLIVACWLLAALLLFDRPRLGLTLALLLLPLHAYHKEIDLIAVQVAVPPAQAVLLCLLPALRRGPRRAWDGWDTLALGWALVNLPGALTVWHWPAYLQGMRDLVVAPLLLYIAARANAPSADARWTPATALWLGGALAAAWGLADWLQGSGTLADGIRRLAAPTSSPNHLALYLDRTLFLGLGLLLAARGRARLGLALGSTVVCAALALTGSRGALLLGLPAGALAAVWLLRRRDLPTLSPGRIALLAATALGLGGLTVWLLGDRLLNSATLAARLEGWTLTARLVRDTFLTGLGPGGFYWRFPAYLPPTSTLDPNLRHPHTLLLELLVTGGLPALAWFVAACGMVVGRLRRAPHLAWPVVGTVTALVAALAHAQVDAFLSLPDLAAWNWVALALLAAAWSPMQKPLPPTSKGSGSD